MSTIDQTDTLHASLSCDWIRENASAYALGGLSTLEMDQVADHRLLCRDCDRVLDRLAQVTGLIGVSVAQISPSPEVKARLMARIRAESEEQLRAPTADLSVEVPTQKSTIRNLWRHPLVSVAPLIVLLFGLGGWSINAQRQLATRSDQISQLERSNEAMNVHLSSLQAGQLAFGAGASSYQLMRVDESAGEAGGVVVSGTGDTTTVFSVWNMPDEHQTYHVVCESKLGELLAAGEIIVNDNGNGTVTLQLPAPVSEYAAVHVLPNTSSGDGSSDILTNDILQALLQEPTVVPDVSE